MDHGSTDEVDTARAARWAEGCRRHEAIRQLVDRHKQPLPRSVVEDVAWELGVSRATLYRLIELYKTFGTVDVLQPGATGRNWDLGIAQSHGANHRGDDPQCLSQTHTTNADASCRLRTCPMH
jgi:hypothetical protein